MMNLLKWLLMTSVLVCIFLIPAFSQEDMEVVDNDEHNEIAQIEDCSECHHVYENGEKLEDESSEDQSCAECHDEKRIGNTPGLKKAFHTNCKGCHLEQKKGPIMCGSCHVR